MTSIYKRKDRDGFLLKFKDPLTLRWRRRLYPTKREAMDARDRLRDRERAEEGLEQDQPFSDYATRWLELTALAVRHSTYRSYEWAVRSYLIPAFRQQSLRSITPRMIRDLVGRLRSSGLDKGSASNVRSTLHSCLEAAVEDRILASNPARFRSRSKLMNLATTPNERRGKVKAMTAEQARRFLESAPHVAPRYALMFRTMLLTGLRPSEALGLKREDVQDGAIRLARAVTAHGIHACKTDAEGQFHLVDVPDDLGQQLRELPDGWLFTARDGGHCEHRGALDAFKRVLGAAGLPLHFTPHCLRHTYATLHLIAGESVYYVSRQLRHADIRMTVRTYGSWLPAGDRAAANRLEQVLGDHPGTTTPAPRATTGDRPGPKPAFRADRYARHPRRM